jgi:cobalt-zinc-cadmium efflux system outer membrane protein
MNGRGESKVESRESKARGKLAAVCLCVIVVASSVALAVDEAPVRTVTLQDALQLLQSQNPDALAARLQIAQAEAERLTARLYTNPTLSVDTDDIALGRTTPPGLSLGQTIGASARIDQPLVLWGKRRLRIESAEAGIAGAKEQERDTLRQLRSAVKDAFYGALHDERLLVFTSANRERYGKIVALNERRFHSGDISEVEFRKIELENLKRLTEEEDSRRTLVERQQLLGRLIGDGQPVQAAGSLTAPDVDVSDVQALNQAMGNRPDLVALQHARDQAELALTLARRERYPDVTIGADYVHSQFVISGDNRNSVGFGFSVPLPLLNQNQGEIAKAEVGLRQADTDLRRLRLDIAQEVHDAVERYQSARRLWRTYEGGYLENAKVVVEAAETAYRAGGASLLEFLDAERTYAATQTDYVDTIFAVRSGLIALEKAVGTDMTTE